ncbi:MAG: ChaN family lipoprotein [Trichloromonadaceae bacterium]
MKSLLRTTLLLGLALPTLLASGCAAPRMLGNPEAPYPAATAPVVGEIRHLPTGVQVSAEQMAAIATDARLIYVGETHDNPASHRIELQLLQALAERYPERAALGMEMFTPEQQPVLDDWVAGRLSEKDFLKQSRWYQVWNFDYDYYRPLLQLAREKRIPVIGLNAGKELVRAVGSDSLTPEQQQSLPQMDLSDPYQRALSEAIFAGHAAGPKGSAGFIRVQTLWDETMADNIARYLQSEAGANRHMLVVAGGNHIRHGFGIPRRVFRRLPLSHVLVASREIEIPASKADRLMDVEIPDFPMPPADFLVYTAYEDLGKSEVKLGVMLDDSSGRVIAQGVLPGSSAERAGVQKGDVLLSLDGQPLADNFDLIYEVKQKTAGNRGVLVVEREGKQMLLEVEFEVPAAMPHPPMKPK